MYYRVCVRSIGRVVDRRAREDIVQAQSLGITSLRDVRSQTLYFVHGALDAPALETLCSSLLSDPVTESATWQSIDGSIPPSSRSNRLTDGTWILEVGLRSGVTDPVANQIVASAAALGIHGVQAATGRRYELAGELSEGDVHTLARKLFCNETIQRYSIGEMVPAFPQPAQPVHLAEPVALTGLSDQELLDLSRRRLLALSLAELCAIRHHFATLDRHPTDVELETLAQTWSEHCVHKTFKALIDLDAGDTCAQIDGLLKSTIRAATQHAGKPWVRSAFVDNAGIIDFDDEYEVSFKVETHNHPSALEPFGGANTGVGGVVRDIIGVSARPIACTDVLCFGPQDLPLDAVPEGILHPRRVKAGVVAGVEDYGNKLGLPTASGALLYDESFTANPLVFVGCVGIAPKGAHVTEPSAGDLVVVIGGRTGRDGLHGATFSSESLTHQTGEIAGTAVQIGDPIVEKDTMEVVCLARDARLYSAITDCGAGGLSSAVGELGRRLGADVELNQVPLKYSGLQPWEIWLSEAQERMVLAVPQVHWPALQQICRDWHVQATAIGTFPGDGRLTVRFGGQIVAQIDMDFLHDGIPRMRLPATLPAPARSEWQPVHVPADAGSMLLRLLAHPNIASKEDTIRRYDHEVGGGTLVKPLLGVKRDGPSDAAVLKPLVTWSHRKALVLSLGINPELGKADPYAMAISAVDEAIRNAVAVGADPDQIALLDNFCWGNPRRPAQLGGLVRAAQGCHDAAVAYSAPFISGKDSLNNEYVGPDGQPTPIPGTLLVSALAILPDLGQAVTMDLKSSGNLLFVLGETRDELRGSHYLRMGGQASDRSTAPALPSGGLQRYRALHGAIQAGLVRACHDLSEGGLAVAAAEMCIAGRLGAALRLADMPVDGPADDIVRLFGESNGRFLIEVSPSHLAAFRAVLRNQPLALIGETGGETLKIVGDEAQVDVQIGALVRAWNGSNQAEEVER
jgi:phosphoribosylformylglycinamidine synthase subunit PurSL